MSVSARTYQVLYIIRQYASGGLSTKLPDFAAFIAVRRKTAPALYTQAYIAPGALQDLLQRMATADQLLTLDDAGNYQMTVLGSQIADLMQSIDGCSDRFINGYKEEMVFGALQQRQRLGQGPACLREIASLTNLSLDSVRRGITVLMDRGTVTEVALGRIAKYLLSAPVPVATASPDAEDIRAVLANLDEGEVPIKSAPPEEVPLGTLLQDEGPDTDPVSAKATAPEPVEAPTPELEQPLPKEAAPEQKQSLPEDDPYKDLFDDGPDAEPWDWNSASIYARQRHVEIARATGYPDLTTYLEALVITLQRRLRADLEGRNDKLMNFAAGI